MEGDLELLPRLAGSNRTEKEKYKPQFYTMQMER
jgi:hypothetical protein